MDRRKGGCKHLVGKRAPAEQMMREFLEGAACHLP
jgi:hypothetical protein